MRLFSGSAVRAVTFVLAVASAGLGVTSIAPTTAVAATATLNEPPQTTVYRGATLFDGTGAPLRRNVSIVVYGAGILDILDADAPVPADASVIDVSGLYALPGLIDAHVHIATPPDANTARQQMRRWLYSGVTAVRDMADDTRSVAELSRQAITNETPSPDIYFAALVAGQSFFNDPRVLAVSIGYPQGEAPWMQAIRPDTDLTAAIHRAQGTGATGLKIYADLDGETVARVTTEARRLGMPVWTHAMVYPATPAEVAASQPDVISHICSIAHQGQPAAERPVRYNARTAIDRAPFLAGDNPDVQAVLDVIKANDTLLDATVRVYFEQDRRRAAEPARPEPLCSGPMTAALTAQAYRSGIRIVAGTDGETELSDPWPALHEELLLLQNEVGMSPSDVLIAATAHAALAANQPRMGVIAPGNAANILFLAEDPTRDVAALKTLRFTVKQGRTYQRRDYSPSVDQRATPPGDEPD